ncbi:MAG: AIPR family protein [Pseudohongiella sp.]|nr:AIPR family protein [Pseudohongiella sp.]
MTEMEEFHQQFIADIQGDADALGLITVEAFFEKTTEILTEAGEIDEANRAYYEGTYFRGNLKVDGYGGDPRDNDNILSLILCDFSINNEIRVVNKDHVQKLQQRIYRFLVSSLKREFRDQIEETSAGYGLADLISTTWATIEKIKLIIVTNALFISRSDADPLEAMSGKQVTLSVWDLKRLKQFLEQGQVRADLLIDFENDYGGGVPVLKASESGSALESYLAVIPGAQLSNIYDKWGPRLLEANVRSFLQARGKVNIGIRNTIRDEPHMFFSYNNGLSATADSVELARTESGLRLVRANNLQIVNGGQTTASLNAARKLFPEQLDQIHVQMKLTIVPREQSEVVVPKISEYANSQNKVNAADFFANHPFHIRVEEFSRKILSPAGQNGYRETKWFYERARGQFSDERGRRSPAERKKFDAEFPRSQFFTKTDLAKYENTFECKPHIVSLGAQKNFTEFARNIGKNWGKDGTPFDVVWYKRMIAKAILFRAMEKIVSDAEWYEGGYRSNIVTFGIAKVVHEAKERNMLIDLDSVWKNQQLFSEMKWVFQQAGSKAQHILTNPPVGIRNITEWAKKELCWKYLSELKTDFSNKFDRILISRELASEPIKDAKSEKAMNKSVNAEIQVHRLGANFWSNLELWARDKELLTPREVGIIGDCAAIPRKMPSEKQCAIAIDILNRLRELGFSEPDDVSEQHNHY